MAIFGHAKFIPVFLGKIVGNNLEWPFLSIQNLYQSFWENCLKKFGMAILAIPNLYQSFFGKFVGKNLEQPFLVILNFF